MCPHIFPFQTLANSYFDAVDVRIGTSQIPNGTDPIGLNNRCQYLPIGAKDYSEVIFDCGSQGILGNIITLQNRHTNLSFLEVQFLGNFWNSLKIYKRSFHNVNVVIRFGEFDLLNSPHS